MKLNREFIGQAVRFGVVGVIATLIHWGIYYLLIGVTPIGVNPAYTIGYVLSFCCNFFLSSRFTFRAEATAERGVGFALSHLCNYLLHMFFLNFFIWLGLSEKIAPLPTLCIVVPINFMLVRTVFTSRFFSEMWWFDYLGAKLYLLFRAHVFNWPWRSRVERREVRRDVLKKSLPWFFSRNYLSQLSDVPELDAVPSDEEKIFTIWLQGEDNAPELVKACFRSIRHHCREELVVLDENTVFDWITLPDAIVKKYRAGKLKAAHFADICRVELLYEHGGYWLDSTCFVTSPIPQWIQDTDFFMFMTEKLYGSVYSFVQNCFIHARKGDYLLAAWRSMIIRYWCQQTGRMDYFQHQLMFKALVQNDPRAIRHFADMPKVGQDATHIVGAWPIDKTYDAAEFEAATSGAFFQKLTYRGADNAPAGSVVDHIKNSWK